MKTIKILLAVVVLGAIGYFIWQSYADPGVKVAPTVTGNQFVDKIRHEIDSLSKLSSNDFNGEFYRNIQYRIDQWNTQQLLGNTKTECENQRDNLSRDLYTVYVSGFIIKAFGVFRSNDWDSRDRIYIANETQELINSPYLDQNSEVYQRLENIKAILDQYNNVQNFVNGLNSYLDSGPFDIDDSMNWLALTKDLKDRALGNSYVYNCTRFHEILNSAPQRAYNKHFNSVRSQIYARAGEYRNGRFTGTSWAQLASDYRDKVYEPIVDDLSYLDQNAETLYGVSASNDLQPLYDRWNRELQNAIEHFQNQ